MDALLVVLAILAAAAFVLLGYLPRSRR